MASNNSFCSFTNGTVCQNQLKPAELTADEAKGDNPHDGGEVEACFVANSSCFGVQRHADQRTIISQLAGSLLSL